MTHEQVMKESRRLLFLMAALFFACVVVAVLRPGGLSSVISRNTVLVLPGFFCVVAGVSQSFWFRLSGMAVCLLGMIAILMIVGQAASGLIIFMLVITRMTYRMIKYGDAQEVPDVTGEEDPLTQMPDRFTENITLRKFIGMVIALIFVSLIVYWQKR
jgi:hypothetical protein